MPRQHPSDKGYTPFTFNKKPCPSCGHLITQNARGRKAHIQSCLRHNQNKTCPWCKKKTRKTNKEWLNHTKNCTN